jgi:uncharacterized protein
VTAIAILETLAREFSIQFGEAQSVFEMLDAGLSAPFVGRFRRTQTGGLSESVVRRLQGRRTELEELDRRRGTIQRLLEKEPNLSEADAEAIRTCMDRFELEDLFVPHRRPEPEVQLAIDRGLHALADELVRPVPRPQRQGEAENAAEIPDDVAKETELVDSTIESEPEPSNDDSHEPVPSLEDLAAQIDADVGSAEVPASEGAEEAPAGETAGESAVAVATVIREDLSGIAGLPVKIEITPELARVCPPYVSPDRGVHTESEALAGAVRILSDRIGRNSYLRGVVRQFFRKRGVLTVRSMVDEGRAARHKPLLKLKQPLRQVQGHRLLALRQAQKERVLNTVITLDEQLVFPKVRALLGRHSEPGFAALLDEVARKSFQVRLAPVIEADVRLELKERGDAEALRFLSQHLRQILLTPPYGPYAVGGVDVSAREDLTLAVLDGAGEPKKLVRIETTGKDAAALGKELHEALDEHRPRALVVGHGKGPRAMVVRLREALREAQIPVSVAVINEAGLSSYANSELARRELPETTVPQRMAISLGRRFQDPMAEILKVDPRHLGLGAEQGLVSKANARRGFDETIESCVAHVGCDLSRVPLTILQHVPGLDAATAERLIERRKTAPFENREQLRAEGLLTEAQWTSAIAFLRLPDSTEPLDRTSLHPELYDLARRVLDSVGGTIEDSLARPGVTRGLKRSNFDVDELTWRDLMRELAQPGRDPRGLANLPELLDPGTDNTRLVKDRVVWGWVTNVASFGVFVDVGLAHDAMIHISEISARYVRDARELLSIGQVVRAKIVDSSGPRLALSLKDVPMEERAPRPPRGGRRRDHERAAPQEPEPVRNVRAAQSRRDGLAGKSGGRPRRGGSGGPGGQGGRGGDRRGGRDKGRVDVEERVDLEQLGTQRAPSYSPFAAFFKNRQEDSKDETPA